jgi:hypothetical protein
MVIIITGYANAQNTRENTVNQLEECVQVLKKYKEWPDRLTENELRKALDCLELTKQLTLQKPTTIFRQPEKK